LIVNLSVEMRYREWIASSVETDGENAAKARHRKACPCPEDS
jgi:hypothetical protein